MSMHPCLQHVRSTTYPCRCSSSTALSSSNDVDAPLPAAQDVDNLVLKMLQQHSIAASKACLDGSAMLL